MSINKVLLGYSYTHLFTCCLWLLSLTTAELTWGYRLYGSQNLKYIPWVPSQEKFANPLTLRLVVGHPVTLLSRLPIRSWVLSDLFWHKTESSEELSIIDQKCGYRNEITQVLILQVNCVTSFTFPVSYLAAQWLPPTHVYGLLASSP